MAVTVDPPIVSITIDCERVFGRRVGTVVVEAEAVTIDEKVE